MDVVRGHEDGLFESRRCRGQEAERMIISCEDSYNMTTKVKLKEESKLFYMYSSW